MAFVARNGADDGVGVGAVLGADDVGLRDCEFGEFSHFDPDK